MTSPPTTIRVLIVEDDEALALGLVHCLVSCLPPGSVVRSAGTLREGKSLLGKDRYHAIVLDHNLPDGEGANLIRVLAAAGGRMALYLVSAHDPDDLEVASLLREFPRVQFIEKPFSFMDVARMIAAPLIDNPGGEQRHYGLGLSDLIQAYAQARRSVTLRILTPENQLGTLAIHQGRLIHAFFQGFEGVSALVGILRTRKGVIRLNEGCPTTKQTITMPTQAALIEAYRLLDESTAERERDDAGGAGLENLDQLLNEAFGQVAPNDISTPPVTQ